MTHKEQSLTNYINAKNSQEACTGFIDGYEVAISFANTKVKEAAPELLEALILAEKIIERLCDDYASVAGRHANYILREANIIENAIKKATI